MKLKCLLTKPPPRYYSFQLYEASTVRYGRFFLWRRAPQQKQRTHRSLKTYCATLVMKMKRKITFFTGEMKVTGENRSTRRKTCPSATLSATNPTWTDPGSNPSFRGGRLTTNRLSHCTASTVG
jgi:hypothetical protein